MNSKERVITCFNHNEADRIPMWCGASPEFLKKAMKTLKLNSIEEVLKRFNDDFRRLNTTFIGPDQFSPTYNLPKNATYRTPFGVLRHGYGYGQPISHPLLNATMEDIENYRWPDPSWISVDAHLEEIKKYSNEYAILGGDWSPFFHDAIDLLGMEQLLIGMYEKPDVISSVFDRIVDYYVKVNEIIFQKASDYIDIFFMGNDLGSQNGPLLGNELFDKYIAKNIERLSQVAKKYDLKVMLHSCGGIEPVIGRLQKAGVDALQALQPDARDMNAKTLKSKYGENMVFNGCIDSHNILIDGNIDMVIEETKRVIEIMKPNGAFILSPSHDYLLEETPVENVVAMYDAGYRFGIY